MLQAWEQILLIASQWLTTQHCVAIMMNIGFLNCFPCPFKTVSNWRVETLLHVNLYPPLPTHDLAQGKCPMYVWGKKRGGKQWRRGVQEGMRKEGKKKKNEWCYSQWSTKAFAKTAFYWHLNLMTKPRANETVRKDSEKKKQNEMLPKWPSINLNSF